MSDLTAIGEIIPALRKELALLPPKGPPARQGPSAIQTRLVETAAVSQDDASVLYSHSVLCQTCLPQRIRGSIRTRSLLRRLFNRLNGLARQGISAGSAESDRIAPFRSIQLPFAGSNRAAFARWVRTVTEPPNPAQP